MTILIGSAGHKAFTRMSTVLTTGLMSPVIAEPQLTTRGKNAAAAAASSLAGGGTAGSCVCTATCQTIVFANGTEYQWTGTGTASSPSACADAAEDFCGGAYSTWLHHWNCKQPTPHAVAAFERGPNWKRCQVTSRATLRSAVQPDMMMRCPAGS